MSLTSDPFAESFTITFPDDRHYFTTTQAAVLIGLTVSFRPLVILLSHKYQIPYEDIGRSVIFSRESVIALRAALLDHRRTHPTIGQIRGPYKPKPVHSSSSSSPRSARSARNATAAPAAGKRRLAAS